MSGALSACFRMKRKEQMLLITVECSQPSMFILSFPCSSPLYEGGILLRFHYSVHLLYNFIALCLPLHYPRLVILRLKT